MAIEVSVKSETVQKDENESSCVNIDSCPTQSEDQMENNKCELILSEFSEEMNDLIENLSNPTASSQLMEDKKK